MRKFKTTSLALPKHLHFPLFLVFLGTSTLAILVSLWWLQQSNVNVLDRKIGKLETEIRGLQTMNLKSKFKPQVDNLERQIKALPDDLGSKQQLMGQIDNLQKQIKALPESIISEEQLLTWQKELLTLEQEKVNSQNAVYRSLIQAVGGLFFVITAYFTWRNIKATEDKQITERFSKAVEQLGSYKIEVRLGGIYSLERIAIDSAKDHWTIMEILTSFVQEKSSLSATQEHDLPPVSKDVQAAITVIGRRDFQKDPKEEEKILDLSSANLTQAYLNEAHLEGANLKEAHLEEAYLNEAHLEGANLKRAHLEGAYLNKAHLEGANLKEAHLERAHLEGANLKEAHLERAHLEGAHLWMAHLEKVNFNRANLDNADLRGADLNKACFDNVKLEKIRYDGAKNLPSVLQKSSYRYTKN